MDFIYDLPANLKPFQNGQRTAPDELIAAVLTFSPIHVVTVAEETGDRSYSWHLYAATKRGLVTATADSEPNPDDISTPLVKNAKVTWRPLTALHMVQFQDVRATSEYYSTQTQVAVAGHWVLEFEGEKAIELPRDESTQDAVTALLGHVMATLQDLDPPASETSSD